MVTVQIGNTDNKLTQAEWAEFCHDTDMVIHNSAKNVYFSGASLPFAPWQNAAWCFELPEHAEEFAKVELSILAKRFGQDSIAWTSGETEFIEPKKLL